MSAVPLIARRDTRSDDPLASTGPRPQQRRSDPQAFVAEKLKTGDRALQRGDLPDALTEFRYALTRAPGNPAATEGLHTTYTKIGALHLERGHPLEALENYVAAKSTAGISAVVKQVLQNATTLEREADEKASQDQPEVLRAAYDQYKKITAHLRETVKILEKDDQPLEQQAHCEILRTQIEHYRTKYRAAEARILVEQVHRDLGPLETQFVAGMEEGLFPAEAATEKYQKAILDIRSQCARIRDLEPDLLERKNVSARLARVEERMTQVKALEHLKTMTTTQDSLLKLSLRESEDLGSIRGLCAQWLRSYQDLSKLSSAEQEAIREVSEVVAGIQDQASKAKKDLSDRGSFLTLVINEKIQETDSLGSIELYEGRNLDSWWQQVVERVPAFGNRWISLSPQGMAHFKAKMREHIHPKPLDLWSGMPCCPFHEYRASAPQCSVDDISKWMDESLRIAPMPDIRERFNPPPSVAGQSS
ncbi:MAG TPA: hypothetical protein VLF94_02225 [Chlamydiales bacterium]|nr:hypothetical protein [Chlamydiales bacterium]